MLIAGRMMTVGLAAPNSARKAVCCMAAGQAAATAALQGPAPRSMDAQALRASLRDAGALLEPAPDPL